MTYNLTTVEAEALQFLIPLSNDYPDIEHWYRKKVIPGLRNETRLLLPIYRSERIVALGIAKNELEKKICTVRVAPEFEHRGMGLRVFDTLMRWLDTDQPNLTVSEHKLQKFERIFDYYGFHKTSQNKGLYIPKIIEYGYNENKTPT